LVVSNGGDPITVARIIGLLRERFSKVSVLLPYVAFSAATLVALGAMECNKTFDPLEAVLSDPSAT
jgi:hypothetical protein